MKNQSPLTSFREHQRQAELSGSDGLNLCLLLRGVLNSTHDDGILKRLLTRLMSHLDFLIDPNVNFLLETIRDQYKNLFDGVYIVDETTKFKVLDTETLSLLLANREWVKKGEDSYLEIKNDSTFKRVRYSRGSADHYEWSIETFDTKNLQKKPLYQVLNKETEEIKVLEYCLQFPVSFHEMVRIFTPSLIGEEVIAIGDSNKKAVHNEKIYTISNNLQSESYLLSIQDRKSLYKQSRFYSKAMLDAYPHWHHFFNSLFVSPTS